MSNPEESVEALENDQPKKGPGGVKAISIFTYLGKSLLILLALGLLIGLIVSKDYFVNKIKDADQNTDQWIMETQILCVVYLLSSIGAIIGVIKMRKGKRSGFFIHAISNIVLIGFLAYNANILEWIIAASLAFFIILYLPFIGKLGK